MEVSLKQMTAISNRLTFLRTTGWRGLILAFLYLFPPLLYVCLGAWWLYENGYVIQGIFLWLGFTSVFSVLARVWVKDTEKILPPLDWEKPWTFAPRDTEAWNIVQEMANRTSDLTLDQLSRMQTYQDATEELALKVSSCYYPKAENPIDKLPIVDLLVAIELAAEDLEILCRQIPGMDQVTPSHLKGLSKALGYAQTANELYNFTLPILRPVTGIPRLIVQKLVAEPALRQTREGLQRWLFRAYINRLGMHLIELSSGRLRIGSESYRKNRRQELLSQVKSPESKPPDEEGSWQEMTGRLLMPSSSSRKRREIVGQLLQSIESDTDTIADYLISQHRPLTGIPWLSSIRWVESEWPCDKEDEKSKSVETGWNEATDLWLNDDLIFVLLEDFLSPEQSHRELVSFLEAVSQAYQRQPDWPVAPILIKAHGWNPDKLNVPSNLKHDVKFLSHVSEIQENSKISEENQPLETTQRFLLAEISLVLPLVRQRQLARKMVKEARHSGFRRVAGQFAQAAGNAGAEMIRGWIKRKSTTSSEQATEEVQDTESSEHPKRHD